MTLRKSSPSTAFDAPTDAAPPAGDTPITLRNVSPEWAALSDKLAELIARRDSIIKDAQPFFEHMRKQFGDRLNNSPLITVAAKAAPAPREGAVALLDGLAIPPPEEPAAPLRQFDHGHPDAVRQRAIADEISDIDEAIKLLRPALEKAHREGSIRLCDLRTADYRQIAVRIAGALIALGDAAEEHAKFAHEMRNSQWAFIRPIQIPRVGPGEDPAPEIRRILAWMVVTGHIKPDALPEQWRLKS